MSFTKSAVIAVLAAATGLGATMTAASAHSKKYKYYGHRHHHHYKTRDFVAGAIVGAAVVGAASYESCKKWKYRYQRTGNPAFLDRYYACKY